MKPTSIDQANLLPPGNTFPKSSRIASSQEFTRILKQGRYAADATLVVNAKPAAQADRRGNFPGRLGVTIPTKTGNAVVRNRWKRLIREAYRCQRQQLPLGYDFVVRPRRGGRCDFHSISRSLLKLSHRASGFQQNSPQKNSPQKSSPQKGKRHSKET